MTSTAALAAAATDWSLTGTCGQCLLPSIPVATAWSPHLGSSLHAAVTQTEQAKAVTAGSKGLLVRKHSAGTVWSLAERTDSSWPPGSHGNKASCCCYNLPDLVSGTCKGSCTLEQYLLTAARQLCCMVHSRCLHAPA